MDMTGERRIPASREAVWTALNDPAVLKACIPGCESLEKVSDTDLAGIVAMKVGPISARFSGRVQLSDLDPPNSYRIMGEGAGGAAGFAKGGAQVRLTEDGAITVLDYQVEAQVGGKIAQLGARLVDATAKSMADTFFTRFVAEVAGPPAEPAAAEGASVAAAALVAPAQPEPLSLMSLVPKEPMGYPRVAWVGAGVFILIFVLVFGTYIF